MKSLIVDKPHGFLIWRGKQTAIANNEPLPVDVKLALWSDGELYGEIILDESQELDMATFDEQIYLHRMRQYEVKLKWPEIEKYYVHKIKLFKPYDKMIPAQINDDGDIVLDDIIEPNENQQQILDIASELPNQILIDKSAIQLTEDKQLIGNAESIKELLTAAFGDIKEYESISDSVLPLYQLALVRAPVLRFKQFAQPPNYRPLESNDTCANCLFFKDNHCELFGVDVYSNFVCDAYAPIIGVKQMPYEKVTRGDEICVIKTDTNEIEECYSGDDASERADELLTALRINVEEDEESKSDESNNEIELVDEKSSDDEKAGRRLRGGMLKRLKESFDTLKEIISWAEKEDAEPMVLDGFSSFGIKETKNGPIFYTYSTNAFEDREGELFSTKALENYVTENSENESKGHFNLFHMQGTDFAEKRFQAVVGRFLLEAGPFLNNDVGRQVKKFLKKNPKSHPILAPEGWGASIEYKYLPEQRMKGIYEWVWITRTSLLPRAAAANINTTGALKMDTKSLSPAQVEMGKEMLGDELFDKLVEDGEIKTAKLEEELNFKDNDESAEEVEPVEKPDSDEPEVEAETESTDEESVEDVETESVEEESVDDEPVETPDNDEQPDIVEVVKSVVGEMFQNMKSELEIIATFPEAIKQINERIDGLEQNQVKQMEVPKASIFDYIKEMSVTESEGEQLSKEEIKKKGPKETPSGDDSYGSVFFDRS